LGKNELYSSNLAIKVLVPGQNEQLHPHLLLNFFHELAGSSSKFTVCFPGKDVITELQLLEYLNSLLLH
jgi:hypothetical protein